MKHIEFFDCSKETDMVKAEGILKNKVVTKNDTVMFPYLLLIWDE